MSDWNAKINYTCNAGGHNAFVSNRWKDFYELTCQEDNNFSTPTWPTCVSSRIEQKMGYGTKDELFSAKYCPSPSDHETEEIKCTTVILNKTEYFVCQHYLQDHTRTEYLDEIK